MSLKILLVDDDELVLSLVRKVLQKDGHHVIIAQSAHDALNHIHDGHDYSVVITDIVMPGLDGGELAQTIKSMNPQVPVLAITGGVENAAEDYASYAEMFTDETLMKPFLAEDLRASLHRVVGNA